MSCYTKKIFALALTGLMFLLAMSVLSWAVNDQPIGSITRIEGEVFLSHRGDTAAFPAILGDAIYLGDRIQTEIASRAQVLLVDESLLNLAEDTYIQIEEYIHSPKEGVRSFIIRVLGGKVRGIVGRYFKGSGSRYIISTPTNTIAVEHGHFVVDAAAGRIQYPGRKQINCER